MDWKAGWVVGIPSHSRVHGAHIPTLKICWACHHVMNMCLHYHTYYFFISYNGFTHGAENIHFSNGSLHRSEPIILFPIIVKNGSCFQFQLKFNMAPKHGDQIARDVYNAYASHAMTSCIMQWGSEFRHIVYRGRLPYTTKVHRNSTNRIKSTSLLFLCITSLPPTSSIVKKSNC